MTGATQKAVEVLPMVAVFDASFFSNKFQTYCHKMILGWYFSNARRPTTAIKQLQTSGDGPIFRLPGCPEKDQQKHEGGHCIALIPRTHPKTVTRVI